MRPAAKRLKLHTVCSSTHLCDTGTGKSDVYDTDLKDVNKSADYTVPKHVDIQPSSISVTDVGQVKKDQIQSSTTFKQIIDEATILFVSEPSPAAKFVASDYRDIYNSRVTKYASENTKDKDDFEDQNPSRMEERMEIHHIVENADEESKVDNDSLFECITGTVVQLSNVRDTSRNSDESMPKALTVPIRHDDAVLPVIDQTINENDLDVSPNRNGEGNNPKIDSLQQQNPVKMKQETKFHHIVEDANKEPTFDEFDSRNTTLVQLSNERDTFHDYEKSMLKAPRLPVTSDGDAVLVLDQTRPENHPQVSPNKYLIDPESVDKVDDNISIDENGFNFNTNSLQELSPIRMEAEMEFHHLAENKETTVNETTWLNMTTEIEVQFPGVSNPFRGSEESVLAALPLPICDGNAVSMLDQTRKDFQDSPNKYSNDIESFDKVGANISANGDVDYSKTTDSLLNIINLSLDTRCQVEEELPSDVEDEVNAAF